MEVPGDKQHGAYAAVGLARIRMRGPSRLHTYDTQVGDLGELCCMKFWGDEEGDGGQRGCVTTRHFKAVAKGLLHCASGKFNYCLRDTPTLQFFGSFMKVSCRTPMGCTLSSWRASLFRKSPKQSRGATNLSFANIGERTLEMGNITVPILFLRQVHWGGRI